MLDTHNLLFKTSGVINPIQDKGKGGGQKASPTSFSNVTSREVGISP